MAAGTLAAVLVGLALGDPRVRNGARGPLQALGAALAVALIAFKLAGPHPSPWLLVLPWGWAMWLGWQTPTLTAALALIFAARVRTADQVRPLEQRRHRARRPPGRAGRHRRRAAG